MRMISVKSLISLMWTVRKEAIIRTVGDVIERPGSTRSLTGAGLKGGRPPYPMPFGDGGYRTSFCPTDREMRRSVFDFHFPKFQNLESARGLVYNFFQNQRRGGERIKRSA